MGDTAVERLLAGVVRGAGVGDLTLDVRIEGEKEFLRHSFAVRLGELFDEAGLDVLDLHVGWEGRQHPTFRRRCQACKKSIVKTKW